VDIIETCLGADLDNLLWLTLHKQGWTRSQVIPADFRDPANVTQGLATQACCPGVDSDAG